MNAYCKPGTPLDEVYRIARAQGRRDWYVDGLEKLTADCGPEVLAVCRELNGPYFGWPGHGDLPFVQGQISLVTRAIAALDRYRNDQIMGSPPSHRPT